MTCKEIENLLPPWIEGVLPAGQKEDIETHLKVCPSCAAAVTNLEGASKLMRELDEIEPPPWLKTRVMARVREETKQKESIFRKFFYPLHIKVPVQALATVLIAVVAWNVYKAEDPEFRQMAPTGTAVQEARKNDVSPEPLKESVSLRPVQEEAPAAVKSEKKDAVPPALLSGSVDSKPKEVPVRAGAVYDEAKTEESLLAVRKKEVGAAADEEALNQVTRARSKEADRTIQAPAYGQKQEDMAVASGAAAKMAKRSVPIPDRSAAMMASPAKPAVDYDVIVRVLNTATAAGEIEILLNRNGAREIQKRVQDGRQIFAAQIRAEAIHDFREGLKAVGTVHNRTVTSDIKGGFYSVRIEMVGE